MARKGLILLFAISLAFLIGCSRSSQVRSTEGSGYLGDYSQFKKGEGDEALLIYRNPNADLRVYKKIILEAVQVYAPRNSDLGKLPAKERQGLAAFFAHAVTQEIAKDYELVNSPSPDTMRIRIALTNAESSSVVFDTVTNILPPALVLTNLKKLATGTHIAVGGARLEGEILDSTSGERLLAVVDERAGGKTFEGKFDKWDDTKASFEYWATRLRHRLEQERQAGS